MKRYILILYLIPFFASAQNQPLQVDGEIRDGRTQMPIPFAYVRVENSTLGVTANGEGKFLLVLDPAHASGVLVFSSMGYRNKIVKVEEVRKNKIVLLEDTVIMLKEILITNINPQDVILSAIKKSAQNYPQGPFEVKGFYRTSYKENDSYVRLFEASLVVADKGFSKPHGYQVVVYQNRKSNDYRQFKWQQGGNALFNYFKKDNIRNMRFFLDEKQMKDYIYEFSAIKEFDGAEVYQIKVSLKDSSEVSYKADVFVRSSDFAVVEVKDVTVVKKTKRYSISNDLQLAFTGGDTHVKYVSNNGKLYPSYSSALAKHDVLNREGVFKGTLDMDEELIVHEVVTGESDVAKNVKKQGDVYLADYPYDENFWKTLNVPVDTQLSRKIKADLNARENLIEQFKNNSATKAKK